MPLDAALAFSVTQLSELTIMGKGDNSQKKEAKKPKKGAAKGAAKETKKK